MIQIQYQRDPGDAFEDILHGRRVGGDTAALVGHQVCEEALDGCLPSLASLDLGLFAAFRVPPHIISPKPERVVAQIQSEGKPWPMQFE